MLRVRAVVHKQQRRVHNVEHLALPELRQRPLDLLDHIAYVHLVAVVVEGHGARRVTAHGDLVGLHGDDVSVLVEHLERLALNLEDHTDRLRVELHEVVQLVAANHVHARADLGRLANVLGEDRDLLQRQIRQERGDAVLDFDNETRLVGVLPGEHLDVVTSAELLPHTGRRHLDLLAGERAVRHVERDDIPTHRLDHAYDARLLALKHLDVVARLQRRLDAALRRIGQQVQVDARAFRGRLAGELQHLVEARMHVVDLQRTYLHVLLEVAIAERLAAKHPHAAPLCRVLMGVHFLHLLRIEQAWRRAETERRERGVDRLLPLAAGTVRVRIALARRHINARHQLHTDLLAILRHVEDLRQVACVLAALDTHPAADRHLGALLLQLE